MDWQVIFTSVVTSLVSSSVVAAGIIYILKKIFDSALDYRFEKFRDESRLSAQESFRRQATIYDKQLNILKEVLSLTYRIRNATLDFVQKLDPHNEDIDREEIDSSMRKIENYKSALREIMFEERALLPPLLFTLVHETHNRVGGLYLQANSFILKKSKSKDELRFQYKQAKDSHQKIDDIYQSMVNAVQVQIGIVKEESNKK